MKNRQHFSKSFGTVYDAIMALPERMELKKRRSRLLSNLQGKVFEVGVGTGINFNYYSDAVEVTGIEPSPYMFEKAVQRRNQLKQPERVVLHNIGCSYPEIEALFEPESLDAVVVTLVLCTIPDPEKALAKFYEWLNPGGKLVVLEHIKSKHKIGAKLQNAVNPYWEKLGEGCQLNRATDELLAKSAFNLVSLNRFKIGVSFIEAIYSK